MSVGQQWQNGRILPKQPSAQIAECSPPLLSDVAHDGDAKKEPAIKANIVKTYEYKISMSYDDLVGRPTQTSCQDGGGSIARLGLAGMIGSGARCAADPLAAAAETEPASLPHAGQSTEARMAATAGQTATMGACKQPSSSFAPSMARAAAATASVSTGHRPAIASGPSGSPACDDAADSAGERCPASSEPPAGRGSHRPAMHSNVAGGCDPVTAAAAATTTSTKLGYGVAPIKDFVHFFESRHADPGSPRKFVPSAPRTAAVANAASAAPAAAAAAAANGCFSAATHPLMDNYAIVTSPRTASLRSNPAPQDTQQSLIRLSCTASGYGKYAPSSDVARPALLASAEVQPIPAAAEQRSERAASESHSVGAGTADASYESELNGHCTVSATSNGHCCTELGNADVAVSCNSQNAHEPRVGKQFLLQTQSVEERLNRLSQQSRDDVDSGLLADEVCGLLRSAIGKATLLVTKKFKQFKELCDKNMTQGDDERYKTTSEDLQGFWDMVMLQVEDVDRAFTEIERLRANGWQCETNSCPKDVDANVDTEPDERIKTSSDSPAAPSSGSFRPKTTPSRRHLVATPTSAENRNRKASASPTTATSASPASKTREEARQRLLAAKKAMRRNSMTSDDVGTPSADVVVFLGGSTTS